jgi:signal transduction histidine kinase
MTSSHPRSGPSVRVLAVTSAAVLGVLVLSTIGALTWMSSLLRRTTDTVIRDSRSMTIATEIELALLRQQNIANLVVLTRDSGLRTQRDAQRASVNSLLQEARRHIAAPEEEVLLDRAARQIDVYLRERERNEAGATNLESVLQLTQPVLEHAVGLLDSLRALNGRQVSAAHAAAARVDRLTNYTGAAAGLLLLAGLLFLVSGVRKYILGPMLDLHQSVARLQAGDSSLQCRERGSKESADLARAFNRMVEAQSRQRENQLAFLAGVAHDLRTPLSALKLGIQALEEAQGDAAPRRTLAMLERQVDHLSRMANDLLDATRIEAGRLEMQVQEFDLRPLVKETAPLHAPAAPRHKIVVRAPDVPVVVRGDPVRIEQVLNNLVSNAIKYSPAGGHVEVMLERDGDGAILSVIDQGIGIARDDVSSLFVAFRRQRPEVAPGAGLGLSVVRRIVSAHGGSVEVDSMPGRGSTFRVRLPLASTGGPRRGADARVERPAAPPGVT